MAARIGLIGVPIETAPVMEDSHNFSVYVPGMTDKARCSIIRSAGERGICVEDLGEVNLGESGVDFKFDRLKGVPYLFIDKLQKPDLIEQLESARKNVLEQAKGFDFFVAVGANHLGGMVLYDEGDIVARLDYHADFAGKKNVILGCASYMDWVAENIKNLEVINYFVRYRECGKIFGKEGMKGDGQYARANHFDIDVDCFALKYRIQNIYPHDIGASEATPELVAAMIKEAKPRKIGIWEYRPERDYDNNGLEFIVEAIKAVQ